MTRKPSGSANRPPLPKSLSKLRKSKRLSSSRNTIKVEKAIRMKKGKKVGIIRRVGEAVDVVKDAEKDVVMAITRWITVTVIVIETIEIIETETEMEVDETTIINVVEAAVAGVEVPKELQLSTIVMMMAADIIEVGGVEIADVAVIAMNAAVVEEVVVVGTEMTTSAMNSIKTALIPPRTHLKKLIMIMNQSVTRVETKEMKISNNNNISNGEEVAAGTVAAAVVDEVVDREVEVDNEEVGEEAVKVVEEVEAIKILIISATLPIRSMLIETY